MSTARKALIRRRPRRALAAAPPAFPVLAAGPVNADARGVAFDGHDPVAKFRRRRASHGQIRAQRHRRVATCWFASESNLRLFKADRGSYEPQYGVTDGHWFDAEAPLGMIRCFG